MKVLLINGSLRGEKSHSLKVADSFVNGLETSGSVELKKLELGKLNINHCVGCFACWKVTPGECAIHDDMDMVRELILESDVIIMSFPLYCFGVPSKLKTMLDRLLPFKMPYAGRLASQEHLSIMDFRYDFSNKKLVLVSTCAHASTDIVYDSVTKEFDLICGKNNYTTVFCPQGEILELEQMKPIFNNYLNKVRKAGEEFGTNGFLTEDTHKKVCAPLIPVRAVEKMMSGYWEDFPQN